ncbi:hypothetical protein pipiens_000974, partial [Culex pipiens pipiens]
MEAHAVACVTINALRTGITETIAQTMKIHTARKFIQRNGSWAIRNMVSNQCDTFLSHGAKNLLNQAIGRQRYRNRPH